MRLWSEYLCFEFELKLSKSRQCAFQSNIESFLAIAEDLQLKGISDSNVEDTFATLEGPLRLDMNATFNKKSEILKFQDQTTRPDNDVKPGILQNETFEMKPKLSDTDHSWTGVSILISYGEKPHYVKLPIFSEFMENSTKFMKNSDLTKWTQNLR